MGIWPSGTSALHLVVITLALFAGVLPGSVTAIQAPGTDALSRLQPFSRQTQVGHNLPKPPVFPKTFQVAYNFTLPYERLIQDGGLTIDVRVWRDAKNKRIRMDTYESSNILIQTQSHDLEITPRIDTLTCLKFQPDEDDSILRAPILPDLALWEYRGTETLHGRPAGLWVLEQRHGIKHTVYRFYVSPDGQPLRLHMHGNDAFSGAHFDKWIADYSHYSPAVDASAFTAPDICRNTSLAAPKSRFRSFPMQMKAHLPYVLFRGDDQYDRFVAVHGRRHASQAEYDMRSMTFHAVKNQVDTGLSLALDNRSYTMALNQFADWTQEEFEAVYLPGGGRRGAPKNGIGAGEIPYERKVPKGRIPSAVDWRHAGLDATVKDQAACGSCWAFGTTGMLQGAYWMATGQAASFSEQQLVDCSWNYGANMACDGGDFDAAMDYLAEAGGAVHAADYPYRGANGFCRDSNSSSTPPVQFKGYAMVPAHDDEALMEAVYSRGPLAVTIDAAQPGFRFYSGGVYDSPTCKWKERDLDHIVTLVGYGTTSEGHDYWLIRNSWSTYWGMDGYVKIARGPKGRDCGVTTSSAYAVFE